MSINLTAFNPSSFANQPQNTQESLESKRAESPNETTTNATKLEMASESQRVDALDESNKPLAEEGLGQFIDTRA